MTPELTVDSPGEASKQIPSTAGMTTKVVKGSIWTLAGSVAPLAVSFISTPFVIRMLGADGYGVLVLIALIPTYFGFADLGMSIASTKFASEAYALGEHEKEARVIRTAALIAWIASMPIALGLFVFSERLAVVLNVPHHLLATTALAIKFAAVSFMVNLLNGIFNTPQLTRLRMDTNTLVTVGFRVAGIVATPLILFFGGSIATVAFVLMAASFLTLFGHLLVSRRLLPYLLEFGIEREAIRPMLRYGFALATAGLAGVFLINFEKIVLVRTTSVETLAYYSVAFTLAMMTTTLSASMTQSLVPAFSQLLHPSKRSQLEDLFSRALRINFLVMLPILVILLVGAQPFFTVWAGEDFGRESSVPFYVLLIGIGVAINNYVPLSLLMASGRAKIIAKIYWAEALPYLGLIILLTIPLGALGAALAWTIRAIADTVLISWFCVRQNGVKYKMPTGDWRSLLQVLVTLAPLVIAAFFPNLSYLVFIVLPISIIGYLLLAWHKLIASEEKVWLLDRIRAVWG